MKENKPLFNKLFSNLKRKPVSFHVPGHKYGKGFNPEGKKIYKDILKVDVTEIPGFDDLYQPTGIIRDAEQLAAKVFGAQHTFFLVNGSTAGNLAMVLSTCKPGDKIIVQRNVHKSVINAILLAKAKPVYLYPDMIPRLMLPGSIKIDDLYEILIKHQDAKALLLLNPNYYGIGINLEEIAALVHRYGIPLLVDEAHGAHFGLHPSFPKSALQMGADLVVQSTHKTLSAMTMGSMLHVNSNIIDIELLKFFLSMVQTSSPSYPIMASLDLTTRWIGSKGKDLWEKQINMAEQFYEETRGLKNIKTQHQINNRYFIDPLKIIMHSKNKKVSGFLLQDFFLQKKIYMELADIYNTLAIVTLGTSLRDIKKLKKAVFKIDNRIDNILKKNQEDDDSPDIDDISLLNVRRTEEETCGSLENILYEKNKIVQIEQSVGEVSAGMVIPYPPGIPALQPGETITKDMVDHILLLKRKGFHFQGVQDIDLMTIKVIAKD